MGKTRDRNRPRSGSSTLSSFPSPSSSSSSDFEFTVSLSPSSKRSSLLCPADELFYKGQLLPLHLSPRISMVRTLLLASSSTSSSSDTTTTASRDSNGSSSSFSADLLLLPECDSSRPSSVTEEDAKRVPGVPKRHGSKYFSLFATRFSSVFLHRGSSKKDSSSSPAAIDLNFQIPNKRTNSTSSSTSTSSAKQVIKKYVKKVKSSLQNKQSQQPSQQQQQKKTFSFSIRRETDASANYIAGSIKKDEDRGGNEPTGGVYAHSQSFSGNLRYPRRKRCAGSCPSSMRSSPTHSGLLCVSGGGGGGGGGGIPAPETSISSSSSVSSSMEELQSAIQGAIAHCKSTMIPSTQKIRNPLANDY